MIVKELCWECTGSGNGLGILYCKICRGTGAIRSTGKILIYDHHPDEGIAVTLSYGHVEFIVDLNGGVLERTKGQFHSQETWENIKPRPDLRVVVEKGVVPLE